MMSPHYHGNESTFKSLCGMPPSPSSNSFHLIEVQPEVLPALSGGLEERMDAQFRDVFGHLDAIHQRLERLEG
jgi:hypothetical protein